MQSIPASILTGKYPTNHGITQYIGGPSGEAHRKKDDHRQPSPPEYERNLRASEITLAEAMRDAGYKTFFAGKWHLRVKVPGPPIMVLILIKAVLMPVVHGRVFLTLQ